MDPHGQDGRARSRPRTVAPDLQNLKRGRLSLDDLMAAARQQGIRRFADIDLAVLETKGRISFFSRTSAQDGAPEEPDPA
nr:YetF domain-containing protein [Rhodococcus pyridinivorans]